jgi:hypothetical protein
VHQFVPHVHSILYLLFLGREGSSEEEDLPAQVAITGKPIFMKFPTLLA